jgi:exosortase/archaeosortase family protein
MIANNKNKLSVFWQFVLKFILLFLFIYYSFVSIIAITAPGGFYLPLIDHYFNLIAWLKSSLIYGSAFMLNLFGYETYQLDNFILRIVNGKGVRIAHDCAGHGILSFWMAYTLSIKIPKSRKIFWLLAGAFILWYINVLRISLLILALNKNWGMPMGIDHHTWFNIFSYLFIFALIFFLEKDINKKTNPKSEHSSEHSNS